MRVFISYSIHRHYTVEAFVKELQSRDERISCFFDSDEIKAGEDWLERVTKEVDLCDVFLFIWDKESIKSDSVKHELAIAYHSAKRIIPVLFESCKRPLQIQETKHYEDFRKTTRSWESLLTSIFYPDSALLSNAKSYDYEAIEVKMGSALNER